MENLFYDGVYKTTIMTNDEELENKINNSIDDYHIEFNKTDDSKIIFVCGNLDIEIIKDRFYIQFLTDKDEKKEGFNSYIYCDNYEEPILDLLRAQYSSLGIIICFDSDDLIYLFKNKIVKNYRLRYDESLLKMNSLNIKNEIILNILYGDDSISLEEADHYISLIDMKEKWLCCYYLNNLDAYRVVSLFLENE